MKPRDLVAAFALALVALTVGSGTPAASADVTCPQTKAFFYTTDTQILATTLGANKSDCAKYYVSITPILATGEPRGGLALDTVHTQGLHALAELRPWRWADYAAVNGWYAAGVKLHDDMITAGYDPATGDTWAINEVGSPSAAPSTFPTDVFNNVDGARQNFRDFVHGLYDGSGGPGDPTMKGVVFAANPPQLAPNVADYAHKLAAWYADAPFWEDMHRYVSSWAQETYADVRAWGVADKPLAQRTAYLNDYFLHGLRVAEQGNDATAAARSFLDEAYVPLANETHRRGPPNPAGGPGYGSTDITVNGMQRFISAQTYAMRAAMGTRLGFAVDPFDGTNKPLVYGRVAAAIHDSQNSPIGACTATGESCDFDVDGAAFTDSWKSLDFTPPDLACTPTSPTWHATDVSIPCTASDGGSDLADPADASFNLATNVPAGTETANASTNSHRVCDNAGNCVTAGPITGIMVDEKGPSLDCGSAPTFVLNQAGATVTAAAADAGSGVSSPSVSATADTSTAGSHSVNLIAADNVGNTTTVSCPYSVGYALSGFERPIANTPTVNTGKAGRTYPVKWQLQDANGGHISTLNAVAEIVMQPTPCSDFATDPDSTVTATAVGATRLRYDGEANQYVYNWATPSTAGCYRLFVRLDSGQTLPAYFQLS